MDIEKIIKFELAKFEVIVPAKTQANIELGFYIKTKYDAQVFYELTLQNKIVRYKDYLVCNKFIIDLKEEQFMFFPSTNERLYRDDAMVIEYFNEYHYPYSIRYRPYFSVFLSNFWILNTNSIYEKLNYNWTVELKKQGRIETDLLIQAINETIKENQTQIKCCTI